MKKIELLKVMNYKKFIEFLNSLTEEGPWVEWFDKKYCKNCTPVEDNEEAFKESAPCELNGCRCVFFPMMNEIPSGENLIDLWLQECEEFE